MSLQKKLLKELTSLLTAPFWRYLVSVEPSAYDLPAPVKKVMHSPPVNSSVNQVASPSHKLVSSPAKHVVTPEIIESPKPVQANKMAKNSPDLDGNFKQLNINDFMPVTFRADALCSIWSRVE